MDFTAVILSEVGGTFLNPESLVLLQLSMGLIGAREHQAWLSRTHGLEGCWDGPGDQ